MAGIEGKKVRVQLQFKSLKVSASLLSTIKTCMAMQQHMSSIDDRLC